MAKIARSAAVLALLLSCQPALADSIYETPLKCGKVESKIASTCSGLHHDLCSSQKWVIGKGQVDLKDHDFQVFRWACMPSNDGMKVLFNKGNWGNCDTCERYEIWTPKGRMVANWKEFWQDYKQMGFPDLKGEKFSRQFHPVQINDKNP
jgi:hypothetical protein